MQVRHTSPPVSPSHPEVAVRWRPEGFGALVYRTRPSMDLLVLNRTGTQILELCDGRHTREEILETMVSRYPQAPRDRVLDDTRSFFDHLVERGLVRC